IVAPDYGLITNVGSAHLEGFGSFEGVVKTKTELYRYLGKHDGTVFISSEDALLQSHATELKKILYGVSETANYRGELDDKSLFVSFSFTVNGDSYPVHTQLIGGYNFYNLMAAVAVGSTLGVLPEQIVNALESYTPTNNRSQFQDTGKNKLIIDAYNANPSSMKVAIENLKQIDAPFKAVILGDMRELGQASAEEHRKVVELLNTAQFDKVWLCGTEFANNNSEFLCFPTIDLLKAALIENPINGYTILIKGSRGMKLEQILDIL
ncbi:MAG: UDP-N-acetylmuramoyl-tripeptide--D-alanyl-D-alanine ligase, partial [Tannerellaceae bacterium]